MGYPEELIPFRIVKISTITVSFIFLRLISFVTAYSMFIRFRVLYWRNVPVRFTENEIEPKKHRIMSTL